MVTTNERLAAIEDIKQLKARYCRAIDEDRLSDWREIFSADAVVMTPEAPEQPQIIGIDRIVELAETVLAGTTRVHHLHAPEITIVGDEEATGIWALEDNLYWKSEKTNMFGAKRHFRGFGHYREKYRKTPAGWRITEMALSRVYMERDGVRFA
jgi:SnoaL-like domain